MTRIVEVALNEQKESAKSDIHRTKSRSYPVAPSMLVARKSFDEYEPPVDYNAVEAASKKPFWENYDALQAEQKRIEAGESNAPDIDQLDYAATVRRISEWLKAAGTVRDSA